MTPLGVETIEVSIPASNLKSAIASVMQQEGYIESFSMTGEKAFLSHR
jgi:small subunit ribosomal protein S8